MHLFCVLAIAAAAVFSSVSAPAATGPTSDLTDLDTAAITALERQVASLPGRRPVPPASLALRMQQTQVPGLSVAVIENGRIKWARAYGEVTAGSGRKVTTSTLFQAASLSKPVAAAGALRLVDEGRLALDESVDVRLRSWRVPPSDSAGREKVTLRRLLSHTAGLTLSGYPGYAAASRVPSLAKSLAGAAPANTPAVRLFATPGSRTAYSGGGYTVAQLLIEDVTGSDFAQIMDEKVLQPAGMLQSTFAQPLPDELRRDAAVGHDATGIPIAKGSYTYPELAAAGLWTTPSDYGRFLIALQDSWAGKQRALLARETARAMMTPVLSNYGLGVTVLERGGRRLVTHGGSNEGFESRFVAYLDGARDGLVIMTNGQNGGALAAAIQRTISEAYGWPDAIGPPPPRAPEE